MKIVQSFWSRKKDLMQNSFGWLSPQHHLMGWALSSLKLKEYYDDLHLYTDANGKAILIDYLGLPYKTVIPCFDTINHYNENLWAMAKIITYAAQDEPFIHVDGDVFIWDRFSQEIENADLIAQNFETDIGHYKVLMNEVRDTVKKIPDFLLKELDKDYISSYNAGLLGGKDIAFFQEYCKSALSLIDQNYDLSNRDAKISPNFNLLFEQILFYTLSIKQNKIITCFLSEKHENDGYTIGDFCDFTVVPQRLKYLHLIGHHKRNSDVCELMRRTLLEEYPEYYYKIIALFKDQHIHFDRKIRPFLPESVYATSIVESVDKRKENTFLYHRTQLAIFNEIRKMSVIEITESAVKSESPTIKALYQFENHLSSLIDEWSNISGDDLHAIESKANDCYDFFFKSEEEQLNTILERNFYLNIIEESYEWESETKMKINPNLVNTSDVSLGIAVVPQLFFNGYNEIVIDEIDYNILSILAEPMPFRNLLKYIENWFTKSDDDDHDATIYEVALVKLKYLFLNQGILIKF